MRSAISDFGASIQMDPKPFLSYFNMIDITSSYGGIAYTREIYDHAISLAPTFVDVRRKYMLALEDKWGGSLEQMQEFLNECRRQALPKSQLNALESMVREDEALGLEQGGDHAGAESAYRKALELGGAECDSCVALSLSNVLVEENKIEEALPFLNRYLDDHPLDMSTLGWRASLYLRIRKVPEALADLTKAADAGEPGAQNQLGVLYMTGVPGIMKPDAAKGVKWLRQAAAQGNLQARHNLPGAEGVLASQSAPK
jgi:TPR repeat protein